MGLEGVEEIVDESSAPAEEVSEAVEPVEDSEPVEVPAEAPVEDSEPVEVPAEEPSVPTHEEQGE